MLVGRSPVRRKPSLIFHSCLPGPAPDLLDDHSEKRSGMEFDAEGRLGPHRSVAQERCFLGRVRAARIIPRPPCYLLSNQQSDLPAKPTRPTMISQQWKLRQARHDARKLFLRDTVMWILDEAPGSPDVEGGG